MKKSLFLLALPLLLGIGARGAIQQEKANIIEDTAAHEELFGRVEVQKKCKKGYAVLLTNDEKYWTQSYVNKNETMDNQFKIGDKTHILYNKDLDWRKLKENDEKYRKNYQHYPTTILKKNGAPSERAQPIHLSKQYDYQWEDYCPLHNNEKFRFVIIEVL